MTKKIFRSTMLVAGAVLLASFVIIASCLYRYFGGVQEQQIQDELTLAVAGVEQGGMDYLSGVRSQHCRLTWVAEDGHILYDTWARAEEMGSHADRQEIVDALQCGEGHSSRYSATLLEKTNYYARKLGDGTVLRISTSQATAGLLVLGMLQPILMVLVLTLALSALLARRVARRITGPLEGLDLDEPLENNTYEELTPLLRRIHQQHRQIDAQLGELRHRKEEFAQITRSMREGLVLLNEKGCVVSLNRAAQRLFGVGDFYVGRDFLTIEHSYQVSRALAKAFQEGHSEIRIRREGQEYQLDITRIESEGQTVGAVLLAFDVTEQADAERSRREFTANVSHELKTPLHTIMGAAELLENGLVKGEDVPRFVGRIRSEAARLVALIDDIIRLSHMDEGVELPREPVDLYALAEEAVQQLQSAAHGRQVNLSLTGAHAHVLGVRPLLFELVQNLCDNAIKYNVDGGRVDVSVVQKDQQVVLTVSDTGVGIPEEHQSRVFERFYRVDKSHSRQSGGTGLGLSIVKHAAACTGGKIDLTSAPGEGTTITVTFPGCAGGENGEESHEADTGSVH